MWFKMKSTKVILVVTIVYIGDISFGLASRVHSQSAKVLVKQTSQEVVSSVCVLKDVISSSGRIRRLSERGEMASVMEFFFKNKKPLSNS